ncbi:MAG: adenylate/guanylate cyclase domain-containing protein [Coleofasciculaceae cyanobacterium]
MTAASSPWSAHADTESITVDISPSVEDQPSVENKTAPEPQPVTGGLATARETFANFLAPLNPDNFKEVAHQVQTKLKVVNQTLSMLDNMLDSQGFDAILNEMLRSITLKTGELLGADTTTIFLKDEDRNQLWSIIAQDERGASREIRIPADHGSIAAEVATTKTVINIPYDLFDDPYRSAGAKKQFEETGYRTYTMLALPLLNEEDELVAVVQLLNKLKTTYNPDSPLEERLERSGFNQQDERDFEDFAPSIRIILESSQSLRRATQRQRAAQALISATNSLSKSSLDLEETLGKVMDEAKKLMNAHRSTLWLIDHDRGDLWTKLPINGKLTEMRLPIDKNSYAGKVAVTGTAVNIGFDLYQDCNSDKSKETDQTTGYRTCSLLCMPVFNADNELIGVTQLVNKQKQGDFPEYNPASWPEAPECWRASFNRTDQEFMEAFNIQAGVALQNAKLFATVKQQEQMQRDILRSLSDGVISTDKEGKIIAVNESARELLGLGADVRLEGELISEILKIEDKEKREGNKFVHWFETAITLKDARSRQQYYPDQTLLSKGNEQQRSVNLSVNTIADAADNKKVRGALVVMEDISDEKRLKSTMYRYMTQELAEELLKLDDAKLGGDRKDVSILFSDIRGYTALTESLEAEEVVGMLNEYFESMVEAIFKHKGTLDKYIGDAIMAVFGSPLPLKDHAWRAVQTSLEMRYRLEDFNARRLSNNKVAIKIGIGINSDSVISGNIGSSKRMEFTAIGDGVNVGSRLESASKIYGCDIIISEHTYKPCAAQICVRELDKIRVKGKTQPISIYELIGLISDPLPEQKQQVIEHYQKGRELYLNRKFAVAIASFAQALEIDPNDKAADMHMARCQHWLKSAPPDNWDGSWTMTEK